MKVFRSEVYVIYKKSVAQLLAAITAVLIVSCGEHEAKQNKFSEQSQAPRKWTLATNENIPNPINGPSQYAHKKSKSGEKTLHTFMWCSEGRIQIQIHLLHGKFRSTTIYNPQEEKWVTGFYIELVSSQNERPSYILAKQDISKKYIYNLQTNYQAGIALSMLTGVMRYLNVEFSDRKKLRIQLDVPLEISKQCHLE